MPSPAPTITQARPVPTVTPDGAANPGTLETSADLRREYLVGGALPWWGARVQALPPWVDEPSRNHPGTYDAMMTDPQVASTVNLRRLAVLAQGWTLTIPAGLEDDPQAQTIHAFCESCLQRLDTPLTRVLFDLLGALVQGWAVGEQLFADAPDADGRLVLRDIKPKDIRDVTLYVDAYGNELGYRPVLPGMPVQWGAVWDPTQPLYDRRKLIVHKHQPTARAILGQSALRSAWEDWWFKRQLDPEHLKFVVQFASPTLHGKVDPAAKPYRERDPITGAPIPGGALIYPEEVLGAALAGVHNSSYIVTTGADDVVPIAVKSDGNVFLLAYAHKDKAISKAVLYQTLATEEAEHMARAASDTHQDVLDLVFSWDKEGLESTVTGDCLYWLVAYNWGVPAADTYTPRFTLPRVAHQDVNALRTGIAALESSGYLHRSQYPGIDSELALPARDMAQQDADMAAAHAAAQAQAQPPPDANADGAPAPTQAETPTP